MSGHNLINLLSQLASSRPGSIGREATSSWDRTFDQSQRAALVESLPWMSKIHKNPWILGWMKRKPYVFICVYTFLSMNHALKRGEQKKIKIGLRGILNIFPSSTSENDLFAASWVDKVWWSWTPLWSTKADTAGAYPKSQVSSEKWSMNQLWYFWGNLVLEKTTRCGFTIPSSSVPSAEQHETLLTKDCQQSMHHWVIPQASHDGWQNVWGNVGDTTNLWTYWSYW